MLLYDAINYVEVIYDAVTFREVIYNAITSEKRIAMTTGTVTHIILFKYVPNLTCYSSLTSSSTLDILVLREPMRLR